MGSVPHISWISTNLRHDVQLQMQMQIFVVPASPSPHLHHHPHRTRTMDRLSVWPAAFKGSSHAGWCSRPVDSHRPGTVAVVWASALSLLAAWSHWVVSPGGPRQAFESFRVCLSPPTIQQPCCGWTRLGCEPLSTRHGYGLGHSFHSPGTRHSTGVMLHLGG